MASHVASGCEASDERYSSSDTNVMSDADSVLSRMDDSVSVSHRLYSLTDTQDRALEHAQAIESYILGLTERIVRDATRDGHVGHGLLLLNRKCVAEGVRQVFHQLVLRKQRQIRECYNYIRQITESEDQDEQEESHDHEVMQIARGLSRECCAFQRMC